MHKLLALLLCGSLMACGTDYTPKPKAYHRIDFPERTYSLYKNAGCPYQFEAPSYVRIVKDSLSATTISDRDCWMDIRFEGLNGTLHLSYKRIDQNNSYEQLVEDAHKMTYKHTKKADYIDQSLIENQYGVRGMLYEVGGNAASANQFYLSDEQTHFIRGALYFNSTPNIDSMAPVIEFVETDVNRFLETFQWK